jgi:hypothetical protein
MRDRRSSKVAGLGIVGVSLILTAAPTAFAADPAGGFSYGTVGSPNAAVTIQNPTLGQCSATKGIASSGENKTDMAAQVFKDGDCKQLAATIEPGQSDNMVTFASVKFADQGPVPAQGTPAKP